MTNYREILRLHSQGISQRGIAKSCECSRNTVSSVIQRAQDASISWPFPQSLTDLGLRKMLFPEQVFSSDRRVPDFEYIHKEMAKSGVTLSLLWNEYSEETRANREIPYMYTQFCKLYRDYAIGNKATMHIDHKPGEKMEVDWAGQTASIIDHVTGEVFPAYIFVAVLPCSQYAYVEAFLTMNQESWITAHVNAFQFFGGVTRIIAPDNLKTGVTSNNWYLPVVNKVYHEMAEHYGTAIIPCRVQAPKDYL